MGDMALGLGSAEAAAAPEDQNGGAEGHQTAEDGGGNRWPRQETLALLRIRSEMNSTFKDSTLKAPLWEDISRKLGELGYQRSAKKCKEKFENVYKYHKRTKDGRRATGKSDKTYRFFDELEAFDHNHHPPPPPPSQKPHIHRESETNNIISSTTPTTLVQPWSTTNPIISSSTTTTTTTNNNHITNHNPINPTITTLPPQVNNHADVHVSSPASSSSTASDEARPHRKRKRDWKDFFRRLTRRVVQKQEEMQNKFLETVGRCEAERAARDEAWRAHETSRLARENDLLALDRSASAAKDAALLALLEKLSAANPSLKALENILSNPTDATPISSRPPAAPQSTRRPNPSFEGKIIISSAGSPSSRWPKSEVEALINVRTTLEQKYGENGPKGPLWEEVSAEMRRVGYNRSAKRCKEKWENINKYFKKVKDNSKKRSEDSKTCPYFHKLDALYREKKISNNGIGGLIMSSETTKLEAEPIMVQPERQWPLLQNNSEEDIVINDQDEEEEFDRSDSSSTEVEDHDHNHHHRRNDHDHGHDRLREGIANKLSSMDMVI